ncbi:SRPBCC family protein [Deinococcus sp. PESE-13]
MKTNVVFLGIGLLGLVAWAAGQRHDVEAATVVNASPERVWEVLTDTAAYAEWNPVIVRLSGELRPGATIEFVNRGPGGREMTFRPRVLTAQPGRELRWLGQVGVPRLFDGEHYFRLTALPGGQTRLQHGEHFRGVLVPFVRGWLRRNIEPDYAQVNAALGARAERLPHP